jgi:hypothetical protein
VLERALDRSLTFFFVDSISTRALLRALLLLRTRCNFFFVRTQSCVLDVLFTSLARRARAHEVSHTFVGVCSNFLCALESGVLKFHEISLLPRGGNSVFLQKNTKLHW